MSGNPNMLPRETSAGYCRRMGWGPGTHIVGDEGYGPTTITITAVGQEGILAKADGRDEKTWTLECRDWRLVEPAPTDHTAAIAEAAREWRDTLDPSVSMADHAAAGNALRAAVEAESADRGPGCTCVRCAPNYHLMRGCPTCRNKRCPKVSDHDNRCTGSNEPGQIPERAARGQA